MSTGMIGLPSHAGGAGISGIVTQILSTILGLAITIAFVLVQMTATKYISQVIDMFLRWKVNLLPVALFIFSLIFVNTVNTVNTGSPDTVSIILLIACVVSLIPYFYALFGFLKSENLVDRMGKETVRALERGNRKKALDEILKLNKMSKSAIQRMKNEVPLRSADLIRDIMVRYIDLKKGMPAEWFRIDSSDFPGSPPEAIDEINRNRTWLEVKVFQEFAVIFNLILSSWYKLRDVLTGILIATRTVGEKAQEAGDGHVVDLMVKFFNTFARLALNNNDRTVLYNIFYQYRLFAESLLSKNDGLSRRIARHIRYYGTLAEKLGQEYVLETSLYDIMMLVQAACEKKTANHAVLLEDFLGMYDDAAKSGNNKLVFNLEKRYLMLAGFYMLKNERSSADLIKRKLQTAGPRIKDMEAQIMKVDDPDFWEVTDRIINFDYVDEAQKDGIRKFVAELES